MQSERKSLPKFSIVTGTWLSHAIRKSWILFRTVMDTERQSQLTIQPVQFRNRSCLQQSQLDKINPLAFRLNDCTKLENKSELTHSTFLIDLVSCCSIYLCTGCSCGWSLVFINPINLNLEWYLMR